MEITANEAILIISLEGSDRFLDERCRWMLRGLIYEAPQVTSIESPFSHDELVQLEERLPVWGMSDESVWGPLRVKVSNAIYKFDRDEMIQGALPGGIKYARYEDEEPADEEPAGDYAGDHSNNEAGPDKEV